MDLGRPTLKHEENQANTNEPEPAEKFLHTWLYYVFVLLALTLYSAIDATTIAISLGTDNLTRDWRHLPVCLGCSTLPVLLYCSSALLRPDLQHLWTA